MNSNKTYDPHNTLPAFKPEFTQVPWLNTQAIDYKMLKNKP